MGHQQNLYEQSWISRRPEHLECAEGYFKPLQYLPESEVGHWRQPAIDQVKGV